MKQGFNKNSKQNQMNYNEKLKFHKKPSIVKQLFIACVTFKSDVANMQYR